MLECTQLQHQIIIQTEKLMAKRKLLWLFSSLIFFVVQFQENQGCIEEERRSLLKLKAYILSNMISDTDNIADSIYLLSWVDDDPQGECCLWDGVVCSNITHRVIELSLYDIREESYYLKLPSPFNLSIFQPFKELRLLDLSWNGISQIQKEGICC